MLKITLNYLLNFQKILIFSLAAFLTLGLSAQITPSHLYNPVGNSNSFGFAILQRKIGNISASGSSGIPIILEFNTDPQNSPAGFGAYWNISFLNSKLVSTSDSALEWVAPNGWSYYFTKKADAANRKGRGIFEERGGGWICVLQATGFAKIENSKDSESFFEYRAGRLSRFKLGKNQDVYDVRYRGKSGVWTIANLTKNNNLLEFEFSGDRVSAMKVADGAYKFSYTDGTATAPDGVKTFKDYGIPLLSRIEYPDGRIEEFAYVSNEKRRRDILRKDFSVFSAQASQLNKMTISKDGNPDGWLEWDASSGYIVADSGGKYKVGNSSDKLNPEGRNYNKSEDKIVNERPRHIGIEYKNKEKPHAKVWQYDWENLLEIWQNEDTGEIHRYSMIGSQGPSFLKLRKAEKYSGKDIKSDKKSWSLENAWNYDDAGRLVRVLYGNGDIYRVEYDKAGRELRRFMNDVLTKENKYDEKGNLSSIWQIFKGKEYLSDYVNGKRTTYFVDGELVKKVAYDTLGRVVEELQPNVRIDSFVYNDDGTFYRIMDWPDGKRIVTKMKSLDAGGFTSLFSKERNGKEVFYEEYLKTISNNKDEKVIKDSKFLDLLNNFKKGN